MRARPGSLPKGSGTGKFHIPSRGDRCGRQGKGQVASRLTWLARHQHCCEPTSSKLGPRPSTGIPMLVSIRSLQESGVKTEGFRFGHFGTRPQTLCVYNGHLHDCKAHGHPWSKLDVTDAFIHMFPFQLNVKIFWVLFM